MTFAAVYPEVGPH